MIVTENGLDNWVRGNAEEAQGVVVELVWRLVAASAPKPTQRRFPLGDSVGQPGVDGLLETIVGMDPFVPDGRSLWEIGTGERTGNKATADYGELTKSTPEGIRQDSTFVFVTPLSGRRDWPHSWKEGAQAAWLDKRRARNEWSDIRVIDGTKLIDWLQAFPPVELWLAHRMGMPAQQMETVAQHWENTRTIGAPPPLLPDLFLTNRTAGVTKLKEALVRNAPQLKLDTYYPEQIVDFVAACVATLDKEQRADVEGRCIVLTGPDAFDAMTSRRERHVLVAAFDLEEGNPAATKLLQKAQRAGHTVIYGGLPGGIPHANRQSIQNPKPHQIRDALEKAGYPTQRARTLAQKSGGNLAVLLRCIQGVSLLPQWAEHTASSELVIAELLGGWDENSQGDVSAAESLLGKPYGEWIQVMRSAANRPGTPLSHRSGTWRFVARYEGWYALGAFIFDEHLTRLHDTAIAVLKERNPKFDLPEEERYMAPIHGKVLQHSRSIRNGLADTLALLGSHGAALTSCSPKHAQHTAACIVRELLGQADWQLWASLSDLLPLLAEAAPSEFLEGLEQALTGEPSPLDRIFAEEGPGFMGANHLTGTLWALETLAWSPAHLTRVTLLLGELAERDPGGNWANRPANSLRRIFLAWLPQTCASIDKRLVALRTLFEELPDVAWKLVLDLLPTYGGGSSGTRHPTWREFVDSDWSGTVTASEYEEHVSAYAVLAASAAKTNVLRLTELIERLNDLPAQAYDSIVGHLRSEQVTRLGEEPRTALWSELVDLATKHRRFPDADWAMEEDQVAQLDQLIELLAPQSLLYRHQRLFSDRQGSLGSTEGTWQEQLAEMESHRQRAVREVVARQSISGVLELAQLVESPMRVGYALGPLDADADTEILPNLLDSACKPLRDLAGGFVTGRFHKRGWKWVDSLELSDWKPAQVADLLALLPFDSETWAMAKRVLGEHLALYWTRTSVDPHQANAGLTHAIRCLLKHSRPRAALRCLNTMEYRKELLDIELTTQALLSAPSSDEEAPLPPGYDLLDLIKVLQNDPAMTPNDMHKVEWAYLSLLDGHQGGYPKFLERSLAIDPSAYCSVIRLVFEPNNETSKSEPTPEEQARAAQAYRLLSNWSRVPGCQDDGSFDQKAFESWISAARAECQGIGLLEVGMVYIGHVLTHAPPDPSGTWIHHAIARELNQKDAKDMRDGFRTELFNSRGVFGFSAGREELELAETYKTKAEEIESVSFSRLATTLRELASTYERQAERDKTRDPFDDD